MKKYSDNLDLPDFDRDSFGYQSELTKKLDFNSSGQLNQNWVNEVVLWKVNRYAVLDSESIQMLNQIDPASKVIDEDFTRKIIPILLSQKGVRLPMASTFLRFRNPFIYQIIDQRAYRFAMGSDLISSTFQTAVSKEKASELYLEYLRKLQEISSERNQPFEFLDRVLYMADKEHNRSIGIS